MKITEQQAMLMLQTLGDSLDMQHGFTVSLTSRCDLYKKIVSQQNDVIFELKKDDECS